MHVSALLLVVADVHLHRLINTRLAYCCTAHVAWANGVKNK